MKKLLIRLFLFGVVLLAIQITTYLTYAPEKLVDELLDEETFLGVYIKSDSAYIQDFYSSDCYSGDINIYYSCNLGRYEEELKKKLSVDCIRFRTRADIDWSSRPQPYEAYNIYYATWASRRPLSSLFNIPFSIEQHQYLRMKRKHYTSEQNNRYVWVLFFWVKVYEEWYSHDWPRRLDLFEDSSRQD